MTRHDTRSARHARNRAANRGGGDGQGDARSAMGGSRAEETYRRRYQRGGANLVGRSTGGRSQVGGNLQRSHGTLGTPGGSGTHGTRGRQGTRGTRGTHANSASTSRTAPTTTRTSQTTEQSVQPIPSSPAANGPRPIKMINRPGRHSLPLFLGIKPSTNKYRGSDPVKRAVSNPKLRAVLSGEPLRERKMTGGPVTSIGLHTYHGPRKTSPE